MTASVCECPLCQATFQATAEMAGSAVQCPGCARLLQLPDQIGSVQIGGATPQVCQAIRIDVCDCPNCGKGFGHTTQMLGSLVACPHCGSSFQLSASGQLGKARQAPAAESATSGQRKSQPPLPLPGPPKPKKQRFREAEDDNPPLRDGPQEKSQSAKPRAAEPPRIETGKSPAKELPAAGIRIELAKPSPSGERSSRSATPSQSGSSGSTSALLPGERGKPQPEFKSGEAGQPSPVKSPDAKPPTQLAEPPALPVASVSAAEAKSPPPLRGGSREPGKQPELDGPGAPVDAAQLLPPRFYSSDPTIIRQPKGRSESAFVLLPDAGGGFQRVNNTVIRIQHEGETIVLAAPDPSKVRRRRWIVNLITLVGCLAILYLAFRWLLQ